MNKLPTNQNELQQLIESSRESQSDRQRVREQWTQAEDLTDQAWLHLSSMYGHKFLSQFGETPDDTWIRCLTGISKSQMQNGLRLCLENHPEWPPGAAMFRALCEGRIVEKDGTEINHNTAAYKVFPRSHRLEDQTAKEKRKQEGRKHCEALKGLFDDD